MKTGDKIRILVDNPHGSPMVKGQIVKFDFFTNGGQQGCFRVTQEDEDHWWLSSDQEEVNWERVEDYFSPSLIMETEQSIDKHYDFTYNLTPEDTERGSIRLDPYFMGKVWKIGSRDDTGILFHSLKTIARFGDKNDKEREIKALYLQAKRLAEIHGVEV